MEKHNNEQDSKQQYEKPRLRTIELAAEEVLAASCKTLGGGTILPGPGTCDLSGCAGVGS